MTASASNSAFSTPEGLETCNAWLAAFRHETGLAFVTAPTGGEIPLPKAAGDKIKGSLGNPRMAEAAVMGAVLADEGAARRVQAALEAVYPKGFVATIVSAAIAATAAIVGGALAYAKSKKDKEAAKIAAEAARLRAEAEKAAAEAAAKAAEEKTKQTAMLAGGGVLLLALLVWGLT